MLAAAEAVEQLLCDIDLERRRIFLMKTAKRCFLITLANYGEVVMGGDCFKRSIVAHVLEIHAIAWHGEGLLLVMMRWNYVLSYPTSTNRFCNEAWHTESIPPSSGRGTCINVESAFQFFQGAKPVSLLNRLRPHLGF